MIRLHHLNKSRSKRVLWLLEELGAPYEVVPYLRNRQTFLAPPALREVHPLGKSPVVEVDGRVIAESGAIVEYLIDKYAPDRLAPSRGTPEYADYLQWLHFAESSAVLPLLLRMFIQKDGCQTRFLESYADIEIQKVFTHLDDVMTERTYLVGEKLSGADMMMVFALEVLEQSDEIDLYDNLRQYLDRLRSHSSFQSAEKLNQHYEEGAG